MPQLLAAAIVAAIGVSGTIAAVLTLAIGIGLTVGISAIFKPARGKPSDGQQVTRSAIGSRRRHYGIVHTGGQLSFFDSSGGTLGQVVTLGTGEESDILEHRINDKVVTVVGGTVTDASFHGALKIYTRSGQAGQSAISEMTARFPAWTSAHRQRGCAHAAIIAGPVKQELFSEVYNSQIPQYTQVRKAAKVYDPRLDSTAIIYDDGAGFTVHGTGSQRVNDPATWTWNDNGALVIGDYAAHPDGYGLGYDRINWTRIAQEAAICDEDVVTVTGETIKRWRIWTSYSLSQDERRDVLSDMCKAVDAFTWQDAQGLFNLKVGRWEAPTVTISDDHILSLTARLGPDPQQAVSAIKVLYTEASIGYREQESATIGGSGGIDPNTDPQAIQVFDAPHHNQAMRIGKLAWKRLGDDRWHITAQLNLFGLNLLTERFGRMESLQLGAAGNFMVEGLRLDLGRMAVEATLSEVEAGDWSFDAAEEEGSPPVGSGTGGGIVTIDVPTGLTLSALPIVLDGAAAVAIGASWDATGRPDLNVEARYRPSAGGSWIAMTADQDANTAQSGPVDSGTSFEVQIRAVTITGRASVWSASETILPIAALPLSAPSDMSLIGGTGTVDWAFRMPTEPSLAYARLYRTSGTTFTAATQIGPDLVGGLGEVITGTETGLSAGTKHYWVRAFTASGSPSAPLGPEDVAVS